MRVKAVIDRFESDKAVLLIEQEEHAVVWPRRFLPEDISEGDIVTVHITIDVEATRAARQEAEDLLRQVLEQNREE